MYSAPPVATTNRRNATTSSFLPTLAPCCLGAILFLLVATITMALIPLYLKRDTALLNPSILQSSPAVFMVSVEETPSFLNVRRKRTPGDLDKYVGGVFDEASKEVIRQKLIKYFASSNVKDIKIINATLGYKANERRRRFPLVKRQGNSNRAIALLVTYIILYNDGCTRHCRSATAYAVKTGLEALPVKEFVLNNVGMYLDGAFIVANRIQFVSVDYVSDITSDDSGTGTTLSIPQLTEPFSRATESSSSSTTVSTTKNFQ